MASDAQRLIGQLNAVSTLIDNFPMSVLNGLNFKRYSSVFEFLLDVMAAVGIDYESIAKALLSDIMSITIDTKDQLIDDIQNSEIEIGQSPFFQKLEEHAKSFLVNILTGLFTCSAIPVIPDRDMDTGRGFNLPLESIDLNGMLWINPLSKTGKLYYSALNSNATDRASLWQTTDMNAFIWNVLNKGYDINQYEANKGMWDNRRMAQRYGVSVTSSNNDSWIESKSSKNGTLTYNGDSKGEKYFPILQLSKNYDYPNSNLLHVQFPAQRYKGDKINSTLYKFNTDYINSIRIFEPKVILSSIVESLFGFKFSNIASLSIEQTIIEKKLDEVLIQILEEDDGAVTDCFYEFSNDEYNSMLETTTYERYKAKAYNSEANPAVSFDIDNIISQLDSINNSATQQERITKMTKLLQDVTVTPGNEGENHFGLSLNYNNSWWRDLIKAIALPIAKSLLSPQVMLLININLYELGLVNFDNFDLNPTEITTFILNKILAMLASIVRYIRDLIIDLIYKYIIEKIKEKVGRWAYLRIMEEMEEFKLLITEAAACLLLPLPLFNRRRQGSPALDEVNYADIVKEQDVPESNTNC